MKGVAAWAERSSARLSSSLWVQSMTAVTPAQLQQLQQPPELRVSQSVSQSVTSESFPFCDDTVKLLPSLRPHQTGADNNKIDNNLYNLTTETTTNSTKNLVKYVQKRRGFGPITLLSYRNTTLNRSQTQHMRIWLMISTLSTVTEHFISSRVKSVTLTEVLLIICVVGLFSKLEIWLN